MKDQSISNEPILFETQVTLNQTNKNIKFILTTKNLIFEKEKGIFKKTWKSFNTIPLKNIKVIKNKLQVKSNKEYLTIETLDKDITLTCSTPQEAKKIATEIINAKTGTTPLERGTKKIEDVTKTLKEAAVILGTITGIILTVKNHFNKK